MEPSSFDAGAPRLGRYRLLDKLGEGGQGIVYRAEDPAAGTVVAVKVLRSERIADTMVLRRFRKEARLMAEANNPQVVNLLEYNEEDGVPYLVLEFVSGEGLDRLLRRQTRLDEREALAIMAEVARGLMAAHERGIVHRDIKPSNVLMLPPGEPGAGAPRIKISDFGLARHVIDTESMALTASGALLGTPHYMAPEQWTGRSIDARTDVYALGATLYHMLAGRPPFDGAMREALAAQHCNAAPRRSPRPIRPSAKGSCGWWNERWPNAPRIATPTPARCSATWRPCCTASRPAYRCIRSCPPATRIASCGSSSAGTWKPRRGSSGRW